MDPQKDLVMNLMVHAPFEVASPIENAVKVLGIW